MKRFLLSTAIGLTLPLSAQAADIAVAITNSDYADLNAVDDAPEVSQDAFGAIGVDLITATDATATDIAETLAALEDRLAQPEPSRLAVILSGRFVSSATDTYLLPVDFRQGEGLGELRGSALPLSVVLGIMAAYPGEAVLALGVPDDDGSDGAFGPYLSDGFADLAIPQGVTVVTGPAADMEAFAETGLADPETPVAAAADRLGLSVQGFIRPGDILFEAMNTPAAPAPTPSPVISEDALWQTTREADTVEAYNAYLDAFPNGPNANAARAAITEIETDPNRPARLAEESLGLSREARQEIQRDLSILGYDTRGIDGIFGPGTRGAVASWQEQNGFENTTFLTRDQITRLDGQAEVRAAELEAEAEARRAEQERQDRAYWEETGSKGDAAGLRAYLKRYPDGVFAEVAGERLDTIEAEARAKAAARDRKAWDTATNKDTANAYRTYLQEMPDGAFVEEAQARIAAAEEDAAKREARQQAKATEDALRLNAATRRLVEDRLAALDLKPGKVDGDFDNKTRRAIRRYQDARNLPVTGFLDEPTVVRLMADTVLR